jgi:methylated-DNA-[protein]-cysteine S-methyltransferase
MTLFASHPSPLGDLLLVGEAGPDGTAVLTGLYLPGHRRGPAIDPAWEEAPAAFAAVVDQLDAYFRGERTAFDLPVRFVGGSPFQRRVWDALTRIPAGSTVSYGELAAACGVPGAARAVGGAVARNPISIVVPCHRVVGASGAVTGYAGGADRKRHLLVLEGVGLPGAGRGRARSHA